MLLLQRHPNSRSKNTKLRWHKAETWTVLYIYIYVYSSIRVLSGFRAWGLEFRV